MKELKEILKLGLERDLRVNWASETDETLLAVRKDFEMGKPHAVIAFVRAILGRSVYPEDFALEFSVNYETASETIVVDLSLPAMRGEERAPIFDEAVRQCVLRVMHEVFSTARIKHVWGVTVNGWLRKQEDTPCVISLFAYRNEYELVDFSKGSTVDLLKRFKYRAGGPPSQAIFVEPIFHICAPKQRFVYQKGWVDA